jgi:hypothetical protein
MYCLLAEVKSPTQLQAKDHLIHTPFKLWIEPIVEDLTMTVKRGTAIKPLFLYINDIFFSYLFLLQLSLDFRTSDKFGSDTFKQNQLLSL